MLLNLSNEIDKKKAESYLEKLMEDGSKIELKKVQEKRSINQNSYLHVCAAMICQESGYTIEECKIELKRQFGKFFIYEKNGHKFLLSSRDLDTVQMTEWIDWIRQMAIDTLGIYIPTPEEYLQHQFELDRQLINVR
jgi:hypothetical protein